MIKTYDLHLRASYDRKRDQILLNADRTEHPELQRGGFHVVLKPGTQSEVLLRQQMIAAGVLTLSPEGDVLGVQLEDLLTPEDFKLARLILESGRNVVFTGLTGTGKTTLLDACLNYINLNTSRTIALLADHPEEQDVNSSMRLHLVSTHEDNDQDFKFRIAKWVTDMAAGSIIAVDDFHVRPYSENWDALVQAAENKQSLYITTHSSTILTDEAQRAGFAAEFRTEHGEAAGERVHSIHLL